MQLSGRLRALVLLTVHNAGITLLTSKSRIGHHEELYLPSTAVLAAEIIKAMISWIILSREYRTNRRKKQDDSPSGQQLVPSLYAPVVEATTTRRVELYKLLVPSVFYAGQNNLLYIGLSHLPATVFQVTYQLRILMTAVCSIAFFRRGYSSMQWFSLIMLTLGVAIVQIPSNNGQYHRYQQESSDDTRDRLLGFAAVLTACVSSAIGGCYFEAMLKPSRSTSSITPPPPASLAMRNFQLAIASISFAAIGIFLPTYDRGRLLSHGFFHHWTPLTCFVIFNQALGGLLIAAVVKEADSVSKGFATSAAVLLSTVVTSLGTRTLPSPQFLVGGALVIAATALFAIA